MSDPLSIFINKFRSVWQAGTDARLFIECHAGQAWVSLHHHIPRPPPPLKQPPRHPGPSRLHRRRRRADARAAEAAVATAEMAVQTDDVPQTSEVAVQAALVVQPNQVPPAEQVDPVPPLPVYPFLPPPHHLHDEVCQDQVYAAAEQVEHRSQQFSSNIPQLDGLMESQVIADQQTHIWSCKCCQYEKFFKTEDELQLHHNTRDDRGLEHFLKYKECNICYPWHVWS